MNDTGDSIDAKNANWTFGGEVCKTFDEHITRSVPLYEEGHELVIQVADFFLDNGSVCYELGCSTGALTKKLAERNKNKKITVIAIDQEPEMITKAQERCREREGVTFLDSDMLDVEMEKADLIIAYYAMQFVKPKNRQIIFDRIFQSLNWGGGFLLFEKVRAPDARFQDMMSALYTEYKLGNGYKPEEIMAKAKSLKGILEPFSTKGNYDLLTRAGFVDIMTIMKYVCFEGILAIK